MEHGTLFYDYRRPTGISSLSFIFQKNLSRSKTLLIVGEPLLYYCALIIGGMHLIQCTRMLSKYKVNKNELVRLVHGCALLYQKLIYRVHITFLPNMPIRLLIYYLFIKVSAITNFNYNPIQNLVKGQ